MSYINLKIPEHSYFFGFVQMDGSLAKSSRNRGKLQIELGKEDRHILNSFKKLFPFIHSSIRTRIRDTNFRKNHKSYVLAIFNKNFREEINKLGVPYGKKAEIVSSPEGDFSERDYLRGLLDGDGSIGMRIRKYPFISLTVKSERLKNYFIEVIEKITGERKKVNRNKRDSIYNIMLDREKAQKFVDYLYYPGCLCLKRKFKKAKEILKWKRPATLKRLFRNEWHEWEDKYVLAYAIQESQNRLKRTERSIKMRFWRLSNKNKILILS